MSWAMMQKRSLVTLVPGSVFQQLKNAHQLTTVRLKDKLPFDPLGLLLPEKDVSMATQPVAAFLRQFCLQK
jgi:hypothetical protein